VTTYYYPPAYSYPSNYYGQSYCAPPVVYAPPVYYSAPVYYAAPTYYYPPVYSSPVYYSRPSFDFGLISSAAGASAALTSAAGAGALAAGWWARRRGRTRGQVRVERNRRFCVNPGLWNAGFSFARGLSQGVMPRLSVRGGGAVLPARRSTMGWSLFFCARIK